MNLFYFDGFGSEKAHAKKRYNDRRYYVNIFRAAEASAAVVMLGCWCFPAVIYSVETAGDWFRWFAAVIDNHSVAFVLLNVLIISILILCQEKTETESDLYDNYTSVATAVVYPVPVVRSGSQGKQIVPVKSRNESPTVANRRPEKMVAAVSAEEDRVNYYGEAVPSVKKSNYRRTRSETRRTSTAAEVRMVEYRRSESSSAEMVQRAERVSAWGTQAVEGLSSEEFRVKVETFIMEKKKNLLQTNDFVVPTRGHNVHFPGKSIRK